MKQKKSFITMVMCFFVAILMVSCQDSKLKQIVEQLNQECPMSMGEAGEFTSVQYEDGNVVMNYTINEDYLDIDALNKNKDVLKDYGTTFIQNATGDTKELIDALSKEGAGWTIRFKGQTSGKTVSLTLSRNDILNASKVDVKDKDPLSIIEGVIRLTNAQMPEDIEEGLTITEVSLEDRYVVYNVSCDESIISIRALRENTQELKSEILGNFDMSNMAIAKFIQNCKKANVGIAYRYIGNDSGKSCLIKIPVSELPD